MSKAGNKSFGETFKECWCEEDFTLLLMGVRENYLKAVGQKDLSSSPAIIFSLLMVEAMRQFMNTRIADCQYLSEAIGIGVYHSLHPTPTQNIDWSNGRYGEITHLIESTRDETPLFDDFMVTFLAWDRAKPIDLPNKETGKD